jgi:hypothetical protein
MFSGARSRGQHWTWAGVRIDEALRWADRSQSTLLPEGLDDRVDGSNPVRVVDAFVDALNVYGEDILACEQTGITVTLPEPTTSGAKSEGRFGKQHLSI